MARAQRIEYAGAVYHVTARGNERRDIFRDDADRERFLRVLQESVIGFEVRSYLYCLMSNHIHLVVETPRANLCRFMHRLETAYTIYFNRRHRRSGHLMQGRYTARLVERDAYLLRLSRYVHLNPVFTAAMRSRMRGERVAALRGYPWSSYPSYIGVGRPPDWLERGPILATIESNKAKQSRAYRRFVEAGLDSPDAVFVEAARSSPLCIGSEGFCENIRVLYRSLCRDKTGQEDVAFRRMPRRLEAEAILRIVCTRLAVDRDSLLRVRRDAGPRAVAARMLCDHGDLTQRQVAKILGLRSGAAVSKQLRGLARRLEGDRHLRIAVEAIMKDLTQETKAHFNA